MIRYSLIVEASLLTALAVAAATKAAGWRVVPIGVAVVGTALAILGWRAVANAASLNGDFVAYISPGDCLCLLAGAVAPTAVGLTASMRRRAVLLPALAGALAGFVINVVIL